MSHNLPSKPDSIKPEWAMLAHALGVRVDKAAYLVWRLVLRDGSDRPDKIPVDPLTGLTTAPNRACDRGVLDFWTACASLEALIATGALDENAAGIGVFPPNADLAVTDLDGCIRANGRLHMESWAREIVGPEGMEHGYCEVSPGMGGLHILTEPPTDPFLIDRSGGAERAKVGIYGAETRKFVTLTGMCISANVEIGPMPEAMGKAIIARWATTQGSYSADHYTKGRAGADEALADITSGESWHDAIKAFLSRLWNSPMPTQALQDIVVDAVNASPRRETDPKRFHQVIGSDIPRLLQWCHRVLGPRKLALLEDLDSQRWDAVRATVEANRLKAPEPEPEPDPVWQGDVEVATYLVMDVPADAKLPDSLMQFCEDTGNGLMYQLESGEWINHALAGRAYRVGLQMGLAGGAAIEAGQAALDAGRVVSSEQATAAAEAWPGLPQDAAIHCKHIEAAGIDAEAVALLVAEVGEDVTLLGVREAADAAQTMWDYTGEARLQAHVTALREITQSDDDMGWVVEEMPSEWGRRLAQHLYDGMTKPSWGIATLIALQGLSIASANKFLLVGTRTTALNLSTMGFAPTGIGKEHLIQTLTSIAMASRLEVTPYPVSGAALHATLNMAAERSAARPGVVRIQDEIGLTLADVQNPRSHNLREVFDFELQLWNKAKASIPPRRYSNARNDKPGVRFPFYCMAGIGTPAQRTASMSTYMLERGFLNRTLVYDTTEITLRRQKRGHVYAERMPLGLQEALSEGVLRLSNGALKENRVQIDGARFCGVWLSAGYETRLEAFQDAVQEACADLQAGLDTIAARATEQAMRVAALLTIFDRVVIGPEDVAGRLMVEERHVAFAERLVRHLTMDAARAYVAHGAQTQLAESVAMARDAIIRALRKPEPKQGGRLLPNYGIILSGYMTRIMRTAAPDPRALEAVISHMVQAEEIRPVTVEQIKKIVGPEMARFVRSDGYRLTGFF